MRNGAAGQKAGNGDDENRLEALEDQPNWGEAVTYQWGEAASELVPRMGGAGRGGPREPHVTTLSGLSERSKSSISGRQDQLFRPCGDEGWSRDCWWCGLDPTTWPPRSVSPLREPPAAQLQSSWQPTRRENATSGTTSPGEVGDSQAGRASAVLQGMNG